MREVCLGVLVLCVAHAQARGWQNESTPTSLTDARNALGGDAALSGVRAMRMVGRGARSLGPLRVVGDVAIDVVFPDRYLRVDRISLGGRSSEVVTGFNGGRLIQRANAADGTRIDPSASLPAELRNRGLPSALVAARREVGLLLLGFLCSTSDAFPVQFANGGSAESPDGKAELIDIRAADGLSAQLFIDSRTRLPLMVSWIGPDVMAATRARGRTGPPDAPPSLETLLQQVQAKVEHRWYFGDYRSVEALRWPFRIRRSVDGETTEELTFERITVNPSVDPRAFDPER